jgi:hypothetical protein
VAKLSGALANNWVQANHSGAHPDPTADALGKADVATIPDTAFAVPGTVTTAAKTASTSCSGTVTDGTNSATLASVSVTASSTNSGDGTCGGLVSELGSATFTETITYKSTGTAKIAPTTFTAPLAAATGGIGFKLAATTITGSFAGGTGVEQAYIDPVTQAAELGSVFGATATFDSPTAPNVCEPDLVIKTKPAAPGAAEAIGIKLKKPKGLKAITVGAFGGTDPNPLNNTNPSTLVLSKP